VGNRRATDIAPGENRIYPHIPEIAPDIPKIAPGIAKEARKTGDSRSGLEAGAGMSRFRAAGILAIAQDAHSPRGKGALYCAKSLLESL
jgi:hypothetical protein